jgi:hypothetical protein
MTKTFFADAGALMSARTAKYVEAMIREGGSFDYDNWLKRVREEEAQAKSRLAASDLGQDASAKIGNRPPYSKLDRRGIAAPIAKSVSASRAIRRSNQDLSGTTSEARLSRRLEKVQLAWHDFQAERARDAVYDYLQAVFEIVMHFKVRRRTKRLLRHAFRFADLRFDKRADPFTTVIRCTSGGAADNKMISKWARALRYSARCKEPGRRLEAFLKAAGGVNACATRYAKLKQRRNRRK